MKRTANKANRIKRIAVVLAASLLLSEFSEMQLLAASVGELGGLTYEVEENKEEKQQSSENSGEAADTDTNGPDAELKEDSEKQEEASEDHFENEPESVSGNEENEPESVSDNGENETLPADEGGDLLTEEEIAAQKALEPDFLPELEVLELPEHYDASENVFGGESLYAIQESRFDSREHGILSPVRNQSPWGTCWSFAAMGGMETSLAVQGIDMSADLSERHLAYFTYHTGYDMLGNAQGDTITWTGSYSYMNAGGNTYRSSMRLMNWQGAASEAGYPYPDSNSSAEPASLALESAQDDSYHMRSCYFLDTNANDPETIKNVKELVWRYGAVDWSYYHDDSYYNYSTEAYYDYNYDYESSGESRTNHEIMIVGWDDDFPKERFLVQPQSDGAWIVRNSWSEDWGENGYFYISYEDVSLGRGNAAAVIVADVGNKYDNNYFYGNTGTYSSIGIRKAAQVYEVKGISEDREELRAVSFMTGSTNTRYKLQIYKNPKRVNGVVQDPASGTLAAELEGTTTYAGIYTVDLNRPVAFEAGDYMSVVISFPSSNGFIYIDKSSVNGNVTYYNQTNPGESFYSMSASAGGWYDMDGRQESFRINLLTNDVVAAPRVTAAVVPPESFSEAYQVNLRWRRSKSAQAYQVYRSESLNGSYTAIGGTALTAEYCDGISQEEYRNTYYYKVRMILADGSFMESDPVAVQLGPVGFKELQLTLSEQQVSLAWNQVDGSDGYEIQRKKQGEKDYKALATVADPSGTAYIDDLSDMSVGVYQYRVRAYTADGRYSEWSQEKQAALPFKITQKNYKTLSFSWMPVSGAEGYIVWVGFGDYIYSIGSTQKTSAAIDIAKAVQAIQAKFSDRGIPDFRVGDPLTYLVRAVDSAGRTLYQTPHTYQLKPDALTMDVPKVEASKVKLTWTGGGGADIIEIYRSETPDIPDQAYDFVTADNKTYLDANAEVGDTYYYWLCPTVQNTDNDRVAGELTGYKMVSLPVQIPNTVLQSVTAVSDNQVLLTWAQNAQADGYYLYRSETKGQTGEMLAEVEGRGSLSYNDVTVSAGNLYYYSIAPYINGSKKKLSGTVSAQKAIRMLPQKPQFTSAEQSGMSVELKWMPVQGAEGFVIERSLAGGSFTKLAEIKKGDAESYVDKSVRSGAAYTYRIKAYNKAANGSLQYSPASEECSVDVNVGVIENLKAEYENGVMNISWDLAVGAKAYNIYIKTNDEAYEKLDAITSNRYAWKGAESGNRYTVKVIAVTQMNTESTSESTFEYSIAPENISIKLVSAVSENCLRISWDGMEGAVYDVYRSERVNGEFRLLQGNLKDASFTAHQGRFEDNDSIVTGKTYYYKVLIHVNGMDTELSQTEAKSGRTLPSKAVLKETAPDKVTIFSDPNYEYAIGTAAGNAIDWEFKSSQAETLTFEGLEENKKYYIAVRTKEEITGEDSAYGAELLVNTNVRASLVLSPEQAVISKGNRIAITAMVVPSNIHYEELTWSAKNAEGNAYHTTSENDAFIVKGSDDKEILRVVGKTIYAVGDSRDKEVYLWASKETMTSCIKVRINVPVTGLEIRELEADGSISSGNLQIGNTAVFGVTYIPHNADDTTVYWTTSNGRVASVAGRDSSSVLVTAQGAGESVLNAYTPDGVSIQQKISVKKAEKIYGIWLSDKDIDGLSVSVNENGSFFAENLEKKPEYELKIDGKSGAFSNMTVGAYLLTEEQLVKPDGEIIGGTLQKATEEKVTYRSSNVSVATVDKDGNICAVGAGEADIFAFDAKGSGAFGSCHVTVTGNKETVEPSEYPIPKGQRILAVTASQKIQSYKNDSQGSCTLQVKNQGGEILDAEKFTFISGNPSACMVDEKGIVTPNPEFMPQKDTAVKITAFLKNDPSKRKVTFTVTVLKANQIDRVEMKQILENGEAKAEKDIEGLIRQKYEKGMTLTFKAKAYDCNLEEIVNPSVGFGVSDPSVAAVKVNADKTVTLTFKKPGRVNLICTAKDSLKNAASVQLTALSSAPVISTKQVNLNKKKSPNGSQYLSDDFVLSVPNGADKTIPAIRGIKQGKNALTVDTGLDHFSIIKNGDGSYSVAIDNRDDFLKNIKNNTIYTLDMETTVSGIPEIGGENGTTENFTIKVKVISKDPSVFVTAPVINRFFVQEEDLTGLLVIKSADPVTDVKILSGNEQINEFDRYFDIKNINGQWYLKFEDTDGSYNRKTIKGKIAFTVKGYEPIVKTLTIKTPVSKPSIKQQAAPSIHTSISENSNARIVLYNNTKKEILDSYHIEDVVSKTINVENEYNGTLLASIKKGASYKNGTQLTATVKLMETKNGKNCWKEPISFKVSIKVITAKKPAVSMKTTTLILNKQLLKERAKTILAVGCQNMSFTDSSKWQLYAYNAKTKKYDLQGDAVNWLQLSYEKKTGKLTVGWNEEALEEVAVGSYKFRVSGFAEGFSELSKDFVIKVIDAKPTATVKVSGKLDLINRSNITLSGKVTLKNCSSPVKAVSVSGNGAEYYKAGEVTNSSFKVFLTEEGMHRAMTTEKEILPISVELENGSIIESSISFKPVQTTPKITVPAPQTIYKSVNNLTRDYDLTKNQTAGTRIKRIDVISAPKGLGVITKDGHVLVTLGDRGLKAGTYNVRVNIYFEGAMAVNNNPDGKPLSKTIKVNVAE